MVMLPFSGLMLASPWLLLLALVVPVVLLLGRRFGSPTLLFAPGGFLQPRDGVGIPRSLRVRLLRLPPVLAAAGLLLLVLALSRPVRQVPVPVEREGIDIVLCLDVSSSMAVNDMDPHRTRLDVAKDAARLFVAGRPDDRIGLVCFARYPDLRCPPTLDHGALIRIISAVTLVENDGPEDATGIGTATARAAQVLGGGEADSRVVILLTDGEENVATADKIDEIAPLHAGQLCRLNNVRVYSIAAGLGSRDAAGDWIDLDTAQIRQVALGTGGRFYKVRDAGAVGSVYAEIDSLTRTGFQEQSFRTVDRFMPFLIAGLLLLILGRVLKTRYLAVLP